MSNATMASTNATVAVVFILIGLSDQPRAQMIFFWLLLMVYLISFVGNGLIITLIIVDLQLHTPMYFFICVLSLIDFVLINNVVPEVLINCFIYKPTITFSRCLSQMYLGLLLVSTECVLLAVMAYDRFAAICQPLHYVQVMSWRLCTSLVAIAVTLAFTFTLINGLLQPTDFCGHHIINHFVCELQSFVKLGCSNSHISEVLMNVSSLFLLIPPFGFIVVTYGRIGRAVMHICSSQGYKKAFSTCSSHLAVVSIFYGTIIIMYMVPEKESVSDKRKILSIVYGALTPMLNPVIYSLRNRDVKGAFWKLVGKKISD